MLSLSKFYKKKEHITELMSITSGSSKISLRLLDWFVTNYSKKHNTNICKIDDKKNIYHFNVYLSYRSQLKAYSKQQFDPFRRRERIQFYHERENYIETTIGQLNFFRWVIENNISSYIIDNIGKIESDMISTQKKGDANKAETSIAEKKRNELSKSFVKNMNKTTGVRLIAFT